MNGEVVTQTFANPSDVAKFSLDTQSSGKLESTQGVYLHLKRWSFNHFKHRRTYQVSPSFRLV
ncbi:MAG: hypothetical protein ACPG49_11380 [Chitinophagales bacterium]